jgi:hypothetical protein
LESFEKDMSLRGIQRYEKGVYPMRESSLNLFPDAADVEIVKGAIVDPYDALVLTEEYLPTKNSLCHYIMSNKGKKRNWIRSDGIEQTKEERIRDAYNYIKEDLRPKKVIDLPHDRVYVNLTNSNKTTISYPFAHLLDHLTKIRLIPDEFKKSPLCFLVSDTKDVKEFDTWINILAHPLDHKTIVLKRGDSSLYRCGELLDIKYTAEPIQFASKEEFEWVKTQFENYYPNQNQNQNEESKKVFLARIPPIGRHIKNWEILKPELEKNNIQIITGEESVEEIYRCMRNATHVCGYHGGLYKYTMFCQKETRILEYCPKSRKVVCFARQYKESDCYAIKLVDGDERHNASLPLEEILDFYQLDRQDDIHIALIGNTQSQKILKYLEEMDIRVKTTFIPNPKGNDMDAAKIPENGTVLSDSKKFAPNVTTINTLATNHAPEGGWDIDLLKVVDEVTSDWLNRKLGFDQITEPKHSIGNHMHIEGRSKLMAEILYNSIQTTKDAMPTPPKIFKMEEKTTAPEPKRHMDNPTPPSTDSHAPVLKGPIRLLVNGECHAKRLVKSKEFKASIAPDFEVVDISLGEGRIERVIETLEVFDFQDNDIFLLGGTLQDTWMNEKHFRSKLEKLSQAIFTKYKNAKIVFWNAAAREDYSNYENIMNITKMKESLANGTTIFCHTMKSIPEDFHDGVHYTPIGDKNFVHQINQFILENSTALKRIRCQTLTPAKEMEFPENEAITFILEYKEQIPAEIHVGYHNGVVSSFNHHPGKNVIPDRKNILKLKGLKWVKFDENITASHCQIQHF